MCHVPVTPLSAGLFQPLLVLASQNPILNGRELPLHCNNRRRMSQRYQGFRASIYRDFRCVGTGRRTDFWLCGTAISKCFGLGPESVRNQSVCARQLVNRVPITSTENESLHRQSGIGAFYEPGCSCHAKVSSRLITTSFSTTQCTKSGLAVVSTIGQISRPASLTMHSASEAISRRVRGVFNSGNLRRLFWSYRVTRSCNDGERSRGGLESPQQLSPSPRIRT
jgi:hypothetical protein